MKIFRYYCSRLIVLLSFLDTSSAYGVGTLPSRKGRIISSLLAGIAETNVQDSVPYDAPAKLAYEAAGSPGAYATFKTKYEKDAVKDVIAKRTHCLSPSDDGTSDAEDDENEVDDMTTTTTTLTSSTTPVVENLQRKLNTRQKAYENYLIAQNIALKLKPIYERNGKLDTYKPQFIYDQETELRLKEIWNAELEIKLMQANTMDTDIKSLRQKAQKEQEQIRQLAKKEQDIDSLTKEKNVIISRLQSYQKQSYQHLMEKKQEIDSINKEINNLASKLHDKQSKLELKQTNVFSLQSKVRQIESDIESLVSQLQDKREELVTKEATITSLKSTLQEKEAILIKLQEERTSLRLLSRQVWKILKGRFQKRMPLPRRFTSFVRRKRVVDGEVNEQYQDEKIVVGTRKRIS
jgi:DNA repair exonuclease SbcCD ATPase subunit